MNFRLPRPSPALLLVAFLLALLAGLAVAQYRWLGQVSQAERERMQSSLRASAAQFAQEFDRELTHAFIGLLMPAPVLKAKDWPAYHTQVERWRAQAARPEIVKEIFMADREARLWRLDETAGEFVEAEWPAELHPLRDRFQQEAANLDTMAPFPRLVMGHMVEEVPAIIIPFPVEIPEAPARIEMSNMNGCVIAVLDLGYIRERWIPELAASYFASSSGVDYHLMVTSREHPDRIVYQSDPQIHIAGLDAADASATFMAVRPEAINSVLASDLIRTTTPSGKPGDPPRSMAVRIFSRSVETVSTTRVIGNEFGRWQLLLKHRAGSLDAVVAAARRRNLLIGFGVLVLLGASIVMIVVSTARASRLSRQRMEFIAGVTHELHTPLAVIRSAGENLADGITTQPDQVRRYGALIESEGRRLSEMVEQALEFAGIQSGRRVYQPRAVEAADLIKGALADAAPLLEEDGFEIERRISDGLPPVEADPMAIRRALANLIGNAAKYGGPRRWMSIAAEADGDGWVRITVEDRGPGIAAEDLPHIFEPFYRGRQAIASQTHGSGLGLSLVKHIAEAHGGRVLVESAPGRGSAFTLRLPASRRRAAGENESVPQPREAS